MRTNASNTLRISTLSPYQNMTQAVCDVASRLQRQSLRAYQSPAEEVSSMSGQEWLTVISVLGAALTMAAGAIGAAIGESRIGAAAMDALARQPDEAASITRTLFVSLAMVESTAIFCLVISLILLFANPFAAG
jgi:F-type H+-transporting ATPase subunit c